MEPVLIKFLLRPGNESHPNPQDRVSLALLQCTQFTGQWFISSLGNIFTDDQGPNPKAQNFLTVPIRYKVPSSDFPVLPPRPPMSKGTAPQSKTSSGV